MLVYFAQVYNEFWNRLRDADGSPTAHVYFEQISMTLGHHNGTTAVFCAWLKWVCHIKGNRFHQKATTDCIRN